MRAEKQCSKHGNGDRNMDEKDMMRENPYIKGNEVISEAISKLVKDQSYDNFVAVIDALTARMEASGHFILQASQQEGEEGYHVASVRAENGAEWLACFTDLDEYEKAKGDVEQAYTQYIAQILLNAKDMDGIEGVVINPFGDSFSITKGMIDIFGIELVEAEDVGINPEDLGAPSMLN